MIDRLKGFFVLYFFKVDLRCGNVFVIVKLIGFFEVILLCRLLLLVIEVRKSEI